MLFMRGRYGHFDITEELASVHRSPVHGTTTVEDTLHEVEGTVLHYNFQWKLWKCVVVYK
jgi:hypothetical protein